MVLSPDLKPFAVNIFYCSEIASEIGKWKHAKLYLKNVHALEKRFSP